MSVIRLREGELFLHSPVSLDPELRGGTVAIAVPEGHAVCQELLARDFVVDYRPQAGLRIAPHFYNIASECEAVIDEIQSIIETGAQKRWLGMERKPG